MAFNTSQNEFSDSDSSTMLHGVPALDDAHGARTVVLVQFL